MANESAGFGGKEGQNNPKTIPGGLATTSGGAPSPQGSLQKTPDTPKTIHRAEDTRCGTPPLPKKRGRGAPRGNQNALKTGRWTATTKARRKEIWEFTSQVDSFVRSVEALYGFRIRRYRSSRQSSPVMPDKLRRIYREKARK
jgi:hypothetical protein